MWKVLEQCQRCAESDCGLEGRVEFSDSAMCVLQLRQEKIKSWGVSVVRWSTPRWGQQGFHVPEGSQWVKIWKKSRNCPREVKALSLDGLSGLCVYLHQPRTFGLWTTRTPCGSIRKEQERCNKEATGTGGLRKEGPGVGVSPVKGAWGLWRTAKKDRSLQKQTSMTPHEPRSRSCLGGASKAALCSWKTIFLCLIMRSLKVWPPWVLLSVDWVSQGTGQRGRGSHLMQKSWAGLPVSAISYLCNRKLVQYFKTAFVERKTW